MSIGSNIKRLRQMRGLTQQQLADIVGAKTYTTITKWEADSNTPRGKDLIILSNYFNVSVDEILEISDRKNINFLPVHDYTYFPTAISAGLPLVVEAHREMNTISVPDVFMGKYAGQDLILLRANGESMNEVIPNKSIFAMKEVGLENLNNGDIVVYSHDGEYSVKYFFKHDDRIIFKPYSNEEGHFEQHYSVNDNIRIHGKVVIYIVERN